LIDTTLDLSMHKQNATPEQNSAECADKPERCIRAYGRGNQSANQGDFSDNHYPEPEPEVNELFLDAIEFGHWVSWINVGARLALTAPSNVMVSGADRRPLHL